MNISVIISTYSIERSKAVLECLNSLSKQTLQPNEVILVLDPNEKLIQYYSSRIHNSVKIVVSKSKGLSNARNAGVKSAKGDIVAFIDDDAVADKDWLKNLTRNYASPNFLGAGGLIEPLWANGRPAWFPEELDWVVGCTYKGLPQKKCYVRNPIGCNMSFRKRVFDEIGYFKSNIGRSGQTLFGSEEAEFSSRLLTQIPQAKIIYDPSAVVYHRVPKQRTSFRYSMKRSFYEGASKKIMVEGVQNASSVLYVEKKYANYIVEVAIPQRIRKIYQSKNLTQLLILLLASSLVLAGYLSLNITRVQRIF